MKNKTTALAFVFIAGSILAGCVMFVAGKEIYRGRKIDKEIESLKAEAESIKASNGDLREKIAYLDTDEFREKVAKEKLNLRKDGEKVIEIRPATKPLEQYEEVRLDEVTPSFEKQKIYIKWWKVFFSE